MQPTINQIALSKPSQVSRQPRIVIIGGGAGGIELVTMLGDQLGKNGKAHIVLVDKSSTHVWKPLLHEVAAGSMDASVNQLEYIAQARWHNFEFQQGELLDLDRVNKTITISAMLDDDQNIILPERSIHYDTLILSIGSVTNFFGVPGAAEYAMAIDTVNQAESVRKRLLAACIRAQTRIHESGIVQKQKVNLIIIGGGATGVELAAEIRGASKVLSAYGLTHLDPRHDITITLIEAGPRLLAPLPKPIADHATVLLSELNIRILTDEKVVEVKQNSVRTASRKDLPFDLCIWAGGIKVSPVLSKVGLPTNHIGQVIVSPTLQSITDPDIFAFGDCASCPWPTTGKSVPPRAQAAHQQAALLARAMHRRLAGKSLPTFEYHDYGSLISFGRYETVGNIMGRMLGRTVKIQGWLARLLYLSLYRQHQMTLYGFVRMALDTISQWLRQKTTPKVKLH